MKKQEQQDKRKDGRLWFGLLTTFAWIGLSIYMLKTQAHPVRLNEWGDFFAGFFAPLAFLWLVLGYLQQGDELRQSTKALGLQAEELKNSVEQQTQLVAVSREQMKQELQAIEEERERRRDEARPKFVPQHSSTSHDGVDVSFRMKIVNVGSTTTKLRMKSTPPLQGFRQHNLAILPRDEFTDVSFRFSPEPCEISISYIDAHGRPGEVSFLLQCLEKSLEIGEVVRLS